jgi:fatty-acid desaturase
MKTALKGKNDEFLVMPLKHVLSIMGLVNHPGNPKMWATGHEKQPKTQKRQVFVHVTQTCTMFHGPCKSPRNPKTVGKLMKMALKRKNDEFLILPLKHVLSVMGLVNHPGIPKLWAIAHEKALKRKNDMFLVKPLKHVLSVMDLVNHPGTPKLWAIVHENGHKPKNDEFFLSFLSKICRLSYSL